VRLGEAIEVLVPEARRSGCTTSIGLSTTSNGAKNSSPRSWSKTNPPSVLARLTEIS